MEQATIQQVDASGKDGISPATPAIRVRNLRKSFEGNLILDGISLDILSGERVAIVGGSGCGKTVLAKHFNGLLCPDSGQVLVCGVDLCQANEHQLEEVRHKIGYVFQGNVLFNSDVTLDVYGNVSLPLREDPYDVPSPHEADIRLRVAKMLDNVGLGEEFFDRMPSELSGGQRKRVAVARAMVANPPIIIYDEPTTGLDPESTEMIIDLIDKLHDDNHTTTIAITHEKHLMERMDRIIFLRDGHVHYDGDSEAFFRSADEFITHFLAKGRGSRPHNDVLKRTA